MNACVPPYWLLLLAILFFNLPVWAQSWQQFQEAQYLEKVCGDFTGALILYENLLQQQQDLQLFYLVRYRRAYLLYEIQGLFEEARLEYENITKAAFEPSASLASERLQFLRLAYQQAQQKTIDQLTQNIAFLNTQLELQKDPEFHSAESSESLENTPKSTSNSVLSSSENTQQSQ
ncbi:MAG: hypothetical protein AABZ60_09485, partial [Planctomycetota bacterium]